MLLRFIWNPIGALIVGLLFLAVGAAALGGVNVACASSSTGSPTVGQSCPARRGGATLTYEQWQSEQRSIGLIAGGIGVVLIAGGGIAFGVRRKRRAAAA